ncbi:RHS repeat-associated core domain-containing protein [Zavarzinella formosa]|uniref:RHS repeat-associated core domain-containing protein n=1 Tax=Zavarzinella formosa TaxID=360055 RepID=UPI0002E0101A|nr:RHS repeat-associated core domain-containing protein [Zavarzinella formosa]
MFTQTGWGTKPAGSPALNSGGTGTGSGNSTVSFDDVEAAGSPTPVDVTTSSSRPFGSVVPGSGWTIIGGAWAAQDGIFSQTNTLNADGKKALLTSPAWGEDQEIVASVRVDSWTDGVYARAGVSVRTDTSTGQGYGLVFNGTDQVRFVNDGVQWGNTYSFDWETGVWYRFRLRIEGTTLFGKVWAADDSEPTKWMFRQDGWKDKLTGAPALNGGAAATGNGNSTVSFAEVEARNYVPAIGRTTTYSYEWFGGASATQASRVIKHSPVVSAGENGPGAADLDTTVYDELGRPVWLKDGDGYLHYLAYDPATGAIIKEITDVDTSVTADFADLPSGWVTPVGGGRHLKTVTTVDKLGRPTHVVYPDGSEDYTVYDDVKAEARIYRGWTGTTTTGPVEVIRRDRVGGDVTVGGVTRRYTYTERLMMAPAAIAVDGEDRPTGAEAISNVLTLTRDYVNQAGQSVWHDEYFNLSGLDYLDIGGQPVFELGAAGVNYLRTTTAYDQRGRANRVQTPDGVITRIVYDGLGRRVSDWIGDDDTPVSGWWSPVNPAGMVPVTEYEYDNGGTGAGNLTKVTHHPGGLEADRVTQSWYDWRGRPVAVKEGVETIEATEMNRPLTYLDYDNLGQMVRTRLYDGDGITPADADSDGVPDAPSASLLRSQFDYGLDGMGRTYRISQYGVDQATGEVSESPLVTDFWHDHRGLTVKTARPGGLVEKTAYDGAAAKISTYLTDGGGDSGWADALTLTGDKVLSQTEYELSPNGQVIRTVAKDRVHGETGTGALGTPTTGVRARVVYAGYYYDAAGRLIASADAGTNGGTAWTRPVDVPTGTDDLLVTTFGFDEAGRTNATTAPDGVTDRTVFDTLGRVVSQTLADGTADAFTTEYDYDAQGRLSTVTAPGDRVTSYGYDNLGRAASVTRADGTLIAQTTETAYNLLGEAISVTEPGGAVTATAYDAVGRPAAVTRAAGTLLAQTPTRRYDALGRVVTSTDASGQATTTAYDDINRTMTVTDPTGRTWTTVYDLAGNQVSVTDPDDKTTTSDFDLLGRVTSVTDALSEVTNYEHTVTGDRDAVIDPEGNRTETVYDGFGRTVAVVDPLTKETTTAYDRAGRVVSTTDRLGRRREFGYDDLGRQVSESWYSPGNTLVQTQTYGYDDAGNLTEATDPDGSYTITYDKLDRPVTVEEPFGLTLSFGYDAAGNRATVSDDQGGEQTSVFDLLHRLTSRSMDTSAAEARVDFGYTPQNRTDTLTRYSDLAGTTAAGTTDFAYDDAGRTTGIVHRNASSSVLADFGYDYDEAGRLTSRTENYVTTTFAYDAADQLVQDGATSHDYDGSGNRTDAGYVTGDGNRLESDGTWSYTYDDAGEMVKRSKGESAETWTYGYDHRGQMVWAEKRATDGGALSLRVEYSYDAFGNRIRRVEKDGAGATVADQRFAYDGWDTAKPANSAGTANFDVWADLDTDGDVMTRRMFGTGPDELLVRLDSGGTTAWYGEDSQGSVRLVWDNSGTIVGDRSFNGFGSVVSESGAGLDRYGYAGREWDAELGLQYTRARMYDPSTGRFLTEDPLGQYAGDVNVYRYVGNSPLDATDPSGQVAWFVPMLVGAGLGVGFNGLNNLAQGKGWDHFFDGAAQAAVAGAVAGGLFGPFVGTGMSLPLAGAWSGLFGSLAGLYADAAFKGRTPTFPETVEAAVAGWIVGWFGGKIASKQHCPIRSSEPKAFPRTSPSGQIASESSTATPSAKFAKQLAGVLCNILTGVDGGSVQSRPRRPVSNRPWW